ncbi:hypothetical protein HGRIS_002491 [Hohenbuehelia grisea]|uniref:ATP adenylyltransferase n=1 Tax=Hohenbuehelia grisea TaxID=104357 RepID=A0ABR3JKS8_9AGAR
MDWVHLPFIFLSTWLISLLHTATDHSVPANSFAGVVSVCHVSFFLYLTRADSRHVEIDSVRRHLPILSLLIFRLFVLVLLLKCINKCCGDAAVTLIASVWSRSESEILPTTAMTTPADIISKIPSSFDLALASGDLLYFPSTVEKHDELGVQFEIRLCTALQKKPALPTPHFDTAPDPAPVELSAETKTEKFNPFAPPYNENLYVGELRDEESEQEYVILLNKYSVVQHHFLLVSKAFESQSSPLTPPDLIQAYSLLLAAKKAGKNFFAFYNCGENSGASQPHKHIQFIPIDESDDGPPVERLARKMKLEKEERPFTISALPYANHIYRFPSSLPSSSREVQEHILCQVFVALLDLAISTIRHDPEYPAARPSYNVILTPEHLHVIPRRAETYTLEESGDELSVNSLGFAGMLLVKSDEQMEAVKKKEIGKILRGVALESIHEIQVAGTAWEGNATTESNVVLH